jgi:maltooligosyltrehalose trehalohydrolase
VRISNTSPYFIADILFIIVITLKLIFMSIHKSIGAIFEENHCEFRLWAPKATKAKVHLLQDEPREFIMTPEDHGYWSITIENISPGIRYLFSIDDQPPLPDPASRFQPDGVHEASEAINPDEYSWNDAGWTNMPLNELIIYELHTGTFSESSDFKGIADKIPYFKELGINAIEIMPASQFPGERNWGYDGVYPFAVQNSYGGPSELMKLVDTCHNEGIAVILDVVYNHLGPEGNYLEQFAPYFTEKYKTPWGKAVNFDDRYSDGFRNYVVQNALMWFRDFHIDALRLDAVHAIYDFSAKHIMREIAEETRKLELDVNRPQ